MRFNQNQTVNSISLGTIIGAGFEVLRDYSSHTLHLKRICVWLFRALQRMLLWPVTAYRGVCADIRHQFQMFKPAMQDPSTRAGEPATGTSLSNAGTGLS